MAEEKESHQKGDNVVRSRRKAWANAARCGGGKWSGAPYAGEKLTARVYSAIFAPKTSWGAGRSYYCTWNVFSAAVCSWRPVTMKLASELRV